MSPSAEDRLTAFDRLCGIELVEVSDELVRGSIEVRDHHKQPAGLVHGGVYATIAESLATAGTGHAVTDRAASGLSTQTSFMRPITGGRIEATARARHRGRSTWVWEVEIADAEGRLCVLSRVTISVVPASR
jgi:1,4-dihydroxy-2-naphthoyl-CoA hydrolase